MQAVIRRQAARVRTRKGRLSSGLRWARDTRISQSVARPWRQRLRRCHEPPAASQAQAHACGQLRFDPRAEGRWLASESEPSWPLSSSVSRRPLAGGGRLERVLALGLVVGPRLEVEGCDAAPLRLPVSTLTLTSTLASTSRRSRGHNLESGMWRVYSDLSNSAEMISRSSSRVIIWP